MRWLLLSSLCISVSSHPLHGFPQQPLDIQSDQREAPGENKPLPVVPGVLRPNSLEPLETTTSDLPTVRRMLLVRDKDGAVPEDPVPLPLSAPVDKYVDLNGDNQLSLSEVQYAAFVHHGLSATVVKNLFDQVDTNGDGILTAEEFNNIKPLVSEKAENAAVRYLQSVDTDHNKLLSLSEAQAYILREYGIGHRDVERIWRLVNYDVTAEMTPAEFSKLRRRIRGMTIRLARQMMKTADANGDGHISLDEAQAIAFEQEGIQSEGMSVHRRNTAAVTITNECQRDFFPLEDGPGQLPVSTASNTTLNGPSFRPLDEIGLLKKGRLSKNYERRMRMDDQEGPITQEELVRRGYVCQQSGAVRHKLPSTAASTSTRRTTIASAVSTAVTNSASSFPSNISILDDPLISEKVYAVGLPEENATLKVGKTARGGDRYELSVGGRQTILDVTSQTKCLVSFYD